MKTNLHSHASIQSGTRINRTPAVLATTAALVALSPVTTFAQAVWNSGHGDLGIGYDAGALDPHVHIHAGAVVDGVTLVADAEYAPGDALPTIPLAKGLARPIGTQWDFLGVASGQTVWTFPSTEDVTLPFIGFGAEELAPADWNVSFSITLTGLTGTGVSAGGAFSVYTINSFGEPEVVSIQTADGISGFDLVSLAAGDHAHYNFAFTKEGIYEATFLIEGIHATDGAKSASATYTFGVAAIPEPSSAAALAGFGALGLVALRRRRRQ